MRRQFTLVIVTLARALMTLARALMTLARALMTLARALMTLARALVLGAPAMTLLLGCSGAPPAPEWQSSAFGALGAFQSAYFAGNARVADAEFARARRSLSATGQADLVARAELIRCALRTASLEFDDCPGYRALEADAAPAERAYAAYLAGGAPPASAAADPLGRLVGAGVLLKIGRITPAAIGAAIEAASQNGWRRPLLAWLGVEQKRAEAAGDREAAAHVARRIALVAGSAAP